jgi:DNA-binding transcriptional regulator YbjK
MHNIYPNGRTRKCNIAALIANIYIVFMSTEDVMEDVIYSCHSHMVSSQCRLLTSMRDGVRELKARRLRNRIARMVS